MEKIIKKWGDSLIINFSVDERKVNDINEGDVFDVEMKKQSKLNFTKQDLNKAYEDTGASFGVSQ